MDEQVYYPTLACEDLAYSRVLTSTELTSIHCAVPDLIRFSRYLGGDLIIAEVLQFKRLNFLF